MKAKGILGIVLGAVAGGAISLFLFADKNNIAEQNLPQVEIREKNDSGFHFASYTPAVSAPKGTVDFRETAKKSVNAVVHVTTKTEMRSRGGHQYNDLFEYFFGDRGYGRSPRQQRQPRHQMKSGSGVIISSDGYIVTNNHVVADGDEVSIVLNDKTSYDAKVIGTDEATDLALLKIDAEKLPFLELGNSDDLELGEWVLAVGNPLNLNTTVTAGIVSAKSRSISMPTGKMNIESFIQTDAAVNSGNSGGALVNTSGQLVGINTAIYSRTGSYVGYSFAVPTTIVRKVVSDIKEFGKVQRALLGVSITDINSQLKEEKDLEVLEGVYVAEAVEEGGAAEAGIKKDDVIIEVNGVKVASVAQLQEQISKYRPGNKVKITVDRFGKKKVYNVTLKNKHGSTDLVSDDIEEIFGAEFKDLSEKEKRRYRVFEGVQVKNVAKGKFNATGIKSGFIITSVNGIEIESKKDLQKIINNIEDGDKMRLEGSYPNGKYIYVYTLKK